MKKTIYTILVLLLLTGCSTGISQEGYDKAIAENESLRNEISALRTENESLADLINQKPSEEQVQDAEMSIVFRGEDCSGTYTGTVVDGIPEGTGKFVSDEDWTYNGGFKKGVVDGSCIVKFDDGSEFHGLCENGLLKTGTYSNNDLIYEIKDGTLTQESAIMSVIRGIEKSQEESFDSETLSKYHHRIDSVGTAYAFIEKHLDEYVNADASEAFLSENSQHIDLGSFYKDVTRYGNGSWNWDNWEITNIKTDLFDMLGAKFKLCSISMQQGSDNFLDGYIIGDDIDTVIDSINVGDVIDFNGTPVYSTRVSIDADFWHDDAVIIAKIL